MNIPSLPITASVSDLQRRSAEILRTVQKQTPVLVLKNNRSAAVILSPEIYSSLTKKAAVYEELLAQKAIQTYTDEKGKGNLKQLNSIDDLFKE